ncbi:MAG: phosphoglycerate dehydrogenase [Sphingobacteriales bacterium JAD_PAG50586_3]|nr:MAG: phosphoglycerate dehydrogenase [Sphingobacteriales bacterium JAD_PAG50586_3]
MPRILIIDKIHPYLATTLSQQGFDCIDGSAWDKGRYAEEIGNYDGLVIRTKIKVDKEFIDKAINLRFIARAGAGMENIDVAYAESKGITCLSSPEGNRDSVAEHCVAVLLSLMNNILRADKEIRQGLWRRDANWGTELMGKTVGIIGYGYMGPAFAQRLRGFGVTILAHDKYKTGFGDEYITEASIADIYQKADVVSLHLPLTEETQYYASKAFFNSFAKPIYFLNTARGNNVDTLALVDALKAGKVLGAALDVTEYESFSFEALSQADLPAPFKYLANSDNVILTPT